MRLVFLLFILNVVFVIGKEPGPVYQATGGELIDLIRGRLPENGTLKLTKVEKEPGSLPDGVYFQPDEVLEDPGPFLYSRNATKKIEAAEKRVPTKNSQ